jgi:hypothetical protein
MQLWTRICAVPIIFNLVVALPVHIRLLLK